MNTPDISKATHLTNSKGYLVPIDMVKEIDLTRHELVMELIGKAEKLNKLIMSFKKEVMNDIQAFIELSAEKYDHNLGGKKGNVTLQSFDGKYKVQRSIAENLVFDERLIVAKELIDECIQRWSENSSGEIKVLVEHAFDTDQQGKISTNKVLGLRRLNITDKQWLKAMDAISESVCTSSTKAYVRFYEREDDNDKYKPISLDVAGA